MQKRIQRKTVKIIKQIQSENFLILWIISDDYQTRNPEGEIKITFSHFCIQANRVQAEREKSWMSYRKMTWCLQKIRIFKAWYWHWRLEFFFGFHLVVVSKKLKVKNLKFPNDTHNRLHGFMKLDTVFNRNLILSYNFYNSYISND